MSRYLRRRVQSFDEKPFRRAWPPARFPQNDTADSGDLATATRQPVLSMFGTVNVENTSLENVTFEYSISAIIKMLEDLLNYGNDYVTLDQRQSGFWKSHERFELGGGCGRVPKESSYGWGEVVDQ